MRLIGARLVRSSLAEQFRDIVEESLREELSGPTVAEVHAWARWMKQKNAGLAWSAEYALWTEFGAKRGGAK